MISALKDAVAQAQACGIHPLQCSLNRWVMGVADRLFAAGVKALAMPLFARTAPELELG